METRKFDVKMFVDPDGIWGDIQPKKYYNVQASYDKYSTLLDKAIREVYPNASLEITIEPTMESEPVITGEDLSWVDIEEIKWEIGNIEANVYEDFNWVVAK